MKLNDIKEYLKENIDCDCWYTGRMFAEKEYCITLYPTQPVAPVMAIGGIKNLSYATKAISILVHWGKTIGEAEEKANEIYNLLYGQNPIIGRKQVIKIDFRSAEPVWVGSDSKGIFEYVINMVIFYDKESE